MKMKQTKINGLYKISIDHNLWSGAVIVVTEKTDRHHVMNVIDISEQSLRGQQTVDNNSYIDQKGDFEFIGSIEDFPEYRL